MCINIVNICRPKIDISNDKGKNIVMESLKRNSRHYRRRKNRSNTVPTVKCSRVGEPLKRFQRKMNQISQIDIKPVNKKELKFGAINIDGVDEASASVVQDLLTERGYDVG